MTDIRPILRQFSSEFQPTQIEPLSMAGGFSGAIFWRLLTPRGTLVLRRWPIDHPPSDRLRFIHAVLQHAFGRGMRILPTPIAAMDGSTFVRHAGHLWELTPWLPGAADYWESPRVEKLRAAMAALAEFHISVADFPSSPAMYSAAANVHAVSHRLARLRQLQSGGIDSLAQAINDQTWPELGPLARQFVATLPRVTPPAVAGLAALADTKLPLQPCIRDVWHDHVLFSGDRVTGLIDFGAMQIDTPATDIARLLGSLVGDDATGWQEGLAAYAAVRPLSGDERRAIPALDAAGTILAGCNWIRWVYRDEKKFSDQPQVIVRFRRLLERCGVT